MPAVQTQAPQALGLPLRPYQEAALQAIVVAQARGVRRPLVVLPVGAGKTVVFAHLLRRRLVDPTVQIGLVKAEDNAVDAPVVVASV